MFANTKALGQHLSGDVRDLLRGKLYSIGYDTAGFAVVDPADTDVPPETLFWVDVDDVQRERDDSQPRGVFRYQVSANLTEYRP